MPDRKTFFTNAWESSLATEMGDSDSQMTVSDAAALNVPCYVVVEPQDTGQREYMYVTAKNVNILTVTERYLIGSAAGSGITHANGATVRSAATAQAFTDLHDRIDTVSNAVPGHEADLDPHTQYVERSGDTMTGSLTLAGDPSGALEAATKQYVDAVPIGDYVRLDGVGPMTGLLTLSGAPTADLHAATKLYVDGQVGGISTDHADLTGVTADQHHTRYDDTEAVAALAAAAVYVQLAGDTMTGVLNADGGISLNGAVLQAPADPTGGTHVGDRAYNDVRYLRGDTSDTLAGTLTVTSDLVVNGNDIYGDGDMRLRRVAAGNDYLLISDSHSSFYVNGTIRLRVDANGIDVTGDMIATGDVVAGNGTEAVPAFHFTGFGAAGMYYDTGQNAPTIADNGSAVAHFRSEGFRIASGVGLQFASLPPYTGAGEGSLRWMGVNTDIAQAHTSSSDAVKKNVKPIRLGGSIFDRLEPFWFQYKESHPYKHRWTDDGWKWEKGGDIGRMGFSYEELQEQAPHYTYKADGMEAIGYDGMLPDFMAWAVATIRDLRGRLESAGI